MLIKTSQPGDVQPGEITPPALYKTRRVFLRGLVATASAVAAGALYRKLLAPPRRVRPSTPLSPEVLARRGPSTLKPGGTHVDADEKKTSYEEITHYNNFYEFSTDKYAVAELAEKFVARPWTVRVEGLVGKPRTWDIDELFRRFPLEERVYRHRCVEGWSMVIPWMGFPLGALLAAAEPQGSAKYVYFETLLDPKRFPNQSGDVLRWPYVEGLRLDEAMHPLTILVGGLYGETLPAQDGAPLRLAVPWKYGFKSIKSIVKIRLDEREPRSTWTDYAPNEYGFYSNVNPDVPHPRWSQATERRIGEFGKRPTLLYNGYGEQVASLYAGMDLKKYF